MADDELEDGPHQIMESPEDFVLQGLECCGGAVADKDEIKEGKVIQVAKHPQGSRMDYWLEVEYGESKKAFVHMLMSCGWTSTEVLEDVGDAQFPPDPKGMPKPPGGGLPDLSSADYDQEFVCPEHQEVIKTDANLKAAFPEACEGDLRSIWRGPSGFWLEVTAEGSRYGVHFVEPEEGCGPAHWASNYAVKLADSEEFPPNPSTTQGEAVAF